LTPTGAAGGADPVPPTIAWAGDHVRLVDQRRLPDELRILEVRTVDQLCDAIADLAVRGAPALGAAGAMGVALAVIGGHPGSEAGAALIATRPTAVNLAWGVRRALAAADPVAEAEVVAAADVAVNRAMGNAGLELVGPGASVLTHCNTGSLACVGWGTALGVVRAAHEAGRRPSVWVAETRPLLQGSRLTAWELGRLGIPHRIVVDAAAASLMAAGRVDLVMVGADRVAVNGDVANKVGTYAHAVAAHHHGVPFYVVAPTSTWDASCPDGAAIPIERRPPHEVLELAGTRVAPAESEAENPAFDVTPAGLVTAWVTELGVHRAPPGP
jgi:methylthioribose-1-phosphate isomerase